MSEPIDLYQRLPAVYRQEDARRGYPLKGLLGLISEQANILKQDIDRLLDNFFVETADEWVLPYLGDLVGNTPIHSVVGGQRADVAKTISYRLRKGTLPMLEELARDVSGWSVHAVAFFDNLAWNQHMNHLRRQVGTLQLRDIDCCDRSHSPFDKASHTVDLRPVDSAAGWHHISKVGFFIWRLGSYELTGVQPRQASSVAYGYHFNPLGIRQRLFNTPRAESEETGLAGEIHIAQPIRKLAFHASPGDYFGPTGSIGIRLDGEEQTAADIVCMDLTHWRQRNDGKIGIDVVNGRLALPDGLTPAQIDVSFHYGFSADLGGGGYERRDDETVADPERWASSNPEQPGAVFNVPGDADTIAAALAAWEPDTTPRLLIQLTDSSTHVGDIILDQNITRQENVQLIIQASNKNRPMLAGTVTVPAANGPARVALKGVLIEGQVLVAPNSGLLLLELSHSTLVPGVSLNSDLEPGQPDTPSLAVGSDNDLLDVVIEQSITGPLRLPSDTGLLQITGSIVDNLAGNLPAIGFDSTEPGPECRIEQSTILGPVQVRAMLLGSNSLFTGKLQCDRLQTGCLRFCYVPPDSNTPRRYRCQPDRALEIAATQVRQQGLLPAAQATALTDARMATLNRVLPSFTTRRYGEPAYGQLSLDCAPEIRTGADNGAEMGAFNNLMQPQREANLRLRFEEYLPFGLQAGLIFVN